MELYRPYSLELLTQLVNLNNRGNATVGFVLAVPLMLALAFAGLQLVFLLIVQAQINQVTALTARAMSFKEDTELKSFAEQLIKNQPFVINTYSLDISYQADAFAPRAAVKVEVPIKHWSGIDFTLKSFAYAP